MGSGKWRSVPELVEALGSVTTSDAAMEELIERSSPVVPVLATVVADATADLNTRERAAIVLGLLGSAGAECLLGMVDTGSAEVADLAAWGLRWPPASWIAEPVFVRMLGAAESTVRLRAARGLRFIGVDLRKSHPELVAIAAEDPDPRVREEAAEALAHLA